MAPKQQRIVVQKADPRRSAPKSYFASAYSTLTSPENGNVVRSVAVFGVCLKPHSLCLGRGGRDYRETGVRDDDRMRYG